MEAHRAHINEKVGNSHRSMKRFSASLLRAMPSNRRCRSSARRAIVSPSLSLSALAPGLAARSSCFAPRSSVSSHRSRNSRDSIGDIEGGFASGDLCSSASSRSLKLCAALVTWCGGGDEGGVEEDRTRCRCTSPRNTLPIADMLSGTVRAVSGTTSEREGEEAGVETKAGMETMAVRINGGGSVKRVCDMGASTNVGSDASRHSSHLNVQPRPSPHPAIQTCRTSVIPSGTTPMLNLLCPQGDSEVHSHA